MWKNSRRKSYKGTNYYKKKPLANTFTRGFAHLVRDERWSKTYSSKATIRITTNPTAPITTKGSAENKENMFKKAAADGLP